MSGPISIAVRHLMNAGVTGDALLLAIEEMEASLSHLSGGHSADIADIPADTAAERRRAYDRERKRKQRQKSTMSGGKSGGSPVDIADIPRKSADISVSPPSSPSPSSPRPPSTTTSPSSPPPKEKPPSGAKRKTLLPGSFPDLKAKESAKSYWREQGRPDLCDRVDRIATAFEAHHAAKGSTFADWRRAWQTWYVNQVDMTKPPPSAPAPTKATSKRDEERYRLERLRDDGMWIDTLWGIKPFLPDGSFNEMYVKEGGSQALVEQVFGRRELPLEKAS